MTSKFQDLLERNAEYAKRDRPVYAAVRQDLAILTCIDPRVDPLGVLGLEQGQATIVRNAGARVTTDAIRSLAVAVLVIGIKRIAIVQHTDCAMARETDEAIRGRLLPGRRIGPEVEFLTMKDQLTAMLQDLKTVRTSPLIPDDVAVGMFLLDLRTGQLRPHPE